MIINIMNVASARRLDPWLNVALQQSMRAMRHATIVYEDITKEGLAAGLFEVSSNMNDRITEAQYSDDPRMSHGSRTCLSARTEDLVIFRLSSACR